MILDLLFVKIKDEVKTVLVIFLLTTPSAQMNFMKLKENYFLEGEDYTYMVGQKRKQLLRPSKSSGNNPSQ